jgi:mRNA interferase YafQ
MFKIKIEKSFKKDIDRDKKSGRYSQDDFKILKEIIIKLQSQQELDKKYKRHTLKGNMRGLEVVHIKSDWLLVFRLDKEYLNLLMLGKHTQVYKKFK